LNAKQADAGYNKQYVRSKLIMPKTVNFTQVDRTAFSIVSLSEANDDLSYWLTKTPQERLQGVEMMRQILYGYSDPSIRLQRVLTIVELKES